MGTVSHHIEVNAPAEQAYAWWRGLTNLPAIMPDVKSVEARGIELTHWKVDGPLGRTVEWDARIVEDVPSERIAWSSVRGDDQDVQTSGQVRFRRSGPATTTVEVSLTYDPPGGSAGEAVAKLFADPQRKVERALEAFKKTIEHSAAGTGGGTGAGRTRRTDTDTVAGSAATGTSTGAGTIEAPGTPGAPGR